MISRLALLLAAACINVQPASANIQTALQPAIEPLAQQTVRIATTIKKEAVQKQKRTRTKQVVKHKPARPERFLNPQPEPPIFSPPKPEPPSPSQTAPLKR